MVDMCCEKRDCVPDIRDGGAALSLDMHEVAAYRHAQ